MEQLTLSEHKAKVNGIELFYRIAGNGSPIVLLHGYTQTGHMWGPIVNKLSQTHRVIIPDLRGAGASEKPLTGYDKKNMAQDIHELIKLLKFNKVAIVGHDTAKCPAHNLP